MQQHGPSGINVVGEDYESLEFSISGAQTHYDVKGSVTGAFTRVPAAQHVIIRTDTDIVVKFGTPKKKVVTSDQNRAVTVEAGSVFVADGVLITNIYITTSGTTAVKILIS